MHLQYKIIIIRIIPLYNLTLHIYIELNADVLPNPMYEYVQMHLLNYV